MKNKTLDPKISGKILKIRDKIDQKLAVYIDSEPLVNLFPSYAKEKMKENTDDDLLFSLIFNNVMDLKIKNPDDECNFLVPTYIPIKLNETQFFKLIHFLYHLNEEQTDQLANVLVNQISPDKGFLFKYFVDVGFPNIYQNFISINHCKTASNIIKSLISIAKSHNQGIELATHLLSKFVLSCFPFIQELRNFITHETLLTGINGINQNIKMQFIGSFQQSLIFLTKHHISALKFYFESLPDYKKSLVDQIFTDLLENIKRMNQFVVKSINIAAIDVDNDMIISIDDLDETSGSDYPNIEETLFYNQKEKLVLTYADVYVLSLINENLKDLNFKLFPENILLPQMTFDDAFSIFFNDYQIEQDSQIEKNLKERKFKDINPNDMNRWESYKDTAATKCVDLISLLDLDKEDALPILQISNQDLEANISIQNKLRERMNSILYIKQVEELTIQMKSELLRIYAKFDFEKNPVINPKFFKMITNKSKWEVFSANFLKRNMERIFRENNHPEVLEQNKKKMEKIEKNLKRENKSLEDYVKYIIQLQFQTKTDFLAKLNDGNTKQDNSQKYNLYPYYMIMYKWLSDLLQYEYTFSFDSIKAQDKTDDNQKFDTKEDRTTLPQFYRIINLLKIINEEIIDFISHKKSAFPKEFISSFILLINEICIDVTESQNDPIEDESNQYEDDDDNDNDNDNEEKKGNEDILNAIFSGDLKFSVIYRILNTIITTVSKNPEKIIIPLQCLESLKKMKELFDERKQD